MYSTATHILFIYLFTDLPLKTYKTSRFDITTKEQKRLCNIHVYYNIYHMYTVLLYLGVCVCIYSTIYDILISCITIYSTATHLVL